MFSAQLQSKVGLNSVISCNVPDDERVFPGIHFVWKAVNEVNLKLVCSGVLLLNMYSVA